MSLENEAVVDDSTEKEYTFDGKSEEVASEQPESEDNQNLASVDDETEQVGETEDDFDLSDVLAGGTEPEEKDEVHKIPAGKMRLKRKNAKLSKQLEETRRQLAEQEAQQPTLTQAVAPERDYNNGETDEAYNFRSQQAALAGQALNVQETQQRNDNIQAQKDYAKKEEESLDEYYEEAEQLNLKNYEVNEERFIDTMPKGAIVYIKGLVSKSMTPKIITHLSANPVKAAKFSELAKLQNLSAFNYELGKLESNITDLESRARKSHKKVSTATTDKSIDTNTATGSSVQKMLDKLSNDPDGYSKYVAFKKKHKL